MPGFANRAALTPAELGFYHVREGLMEDVWLKPWSLERKM